MTAFSTLPAQRTRPNIKDRQPNQRLWLPSSLFDSVCDGLDERYNPIQYWRYSYQGFEFRLTVAPSRTHWKVELPLAPGSVLTVPVGKTSMEIRDLLMKFACGLMMAMYNGSDYYEW